MAEPLEDKLQLRQKAIEACLANSRELLASAKIVLEHDGAPRIAFQLAVLALEEVGKAILTGIEISSLQVGHDLTTAFGKGFDDHQRKLFWAVWTPALHSGKLGPKEFEEYKGLASRIHETRLDATYVDLVGDELWLPQDSVSREQAENIVGMTEARIEIFGSPTFKAVSPKRLELLRWLAKATEDLEDRKAVFANQSMAKLAETRDTEEWIEWLRGAIDKAEQDARDKLQAELERMPSAPGASKPKFELTVRFFTFSHSIRPKPLTAWRSGTWVTLHSASPLTDQLLVKITLRDNVKSDQIFNAGLSLSNHVLLALNIGSMGYFYWYLPSHTEHFHEKLVDLESMSKMGMERPRPMIPDKRKRRVLDEARVVDSQLALAVLMSLEKNERAFIPHYLMGLNLVARSDVHLDISAQAFGEFYRALLFVFEQLDRDGGVGNDRVKSHALASGFTEIDAAELVAAGDQYVTTGKHKEGIGFEQALVMKFLLDFNLVKLIRKVGFARFKDDAIDPPD